MTSLLNPATEQSQSTAVDELPECADGLCGNEANNAENNAKDQQGLPTSNSSEDTAAWLASDEAAFWMGL